MPHRLFPEGGVETLEYHCIKPKGGKVNVTDKLNILINLTAELTPYYNNDFSYLFHYKERMINYRDETFNALVLDSNLNVVGPVFSRPWEYFGFWGNGGSIQSFFYKKYRSEDGKSKIIYCPIKAALEQYLYNAYFEVEIDIPKNHELSSFEIELIKSLILIKYDNAIIDEKIEDILYLPYFQGGIVRKGDIEKITDVDYCNLQLLDSLLSDIK